ncbi:MAG: Trigger factor [Microgenomates group bacterium GW2011_GWC2_46_7]|nr:MAG: Trigger factor [Microgenomates group bacterium GW2011_GWC2_46_7]
MTKTAIVKKPDGTISFELNLSRETIATTYDQVLREVAKTTSIKGFRPGKAPLPMVEGASDKSQLYSHVLEHLLSPAYSAVIHEHQLVPLIEPKVTPKQMEIGKDWTLSVEVATSPVVELGAYKQYVKKALTKLKKDSKQDDKLNLIFDALLSGSKLEVSPLLIEEETKSALSRLAKQLSELKLSVAEYAKSMKKTTDELISDYNKSAEANLKLEFILQKLIELEKPTITDAELAALKPSKEQEPYTKYILQKRKVLDFLSAL